MNVDKLNQEIKRRRKFIFEIIVPEAFNDMAAVEGFKNTSNNLPLKDTSLIRSLYREYKNIK